MVSTGMGMEWGAKGNQRGSGQLDDGTETRVLEPEGFALGICGRSDVARNLSLPGPDAEGERISGTGISAVTEVLRGMLDGVVAAVMLPGLCLVVLAVVAAVVQARTFDAGTR